MNKSLVQFTVVSILVFMWLCILYFIYLASVSSSLSYFSTNEIWTYINNTYKRPPWAGNVSITYDDSQIRKVSGIVVPINTKGRPEPPEPYNGYPNGTDIYLDKEYVMALCNGGPNLNLNVVPQDPQWQVMYKYIP